LSARPAPAARNSAFSVSTVEPGRFGIGKMGTVSLVRFGTLNTEYGQQLWQSALQALVPVPEHPI
jgi:hypothetical protein